MIYTELEKHCRERMGFEEIFYLELSMLADALADYFEAAEYCAENGNVYDMPTKTGTYPMVHPQHTVKVKSYANVLKHGPKFGINPADFDKLRGLKPEADKPKGAERFMKKA